MANSTGMTSNTSLQDIRVVYLRNFLSPDAIGICQEMTKVMPKLVVLVSVAMEGNRKWQSTDGGMDVRVQKNWTITRTDRHPGGYEDVNYVHVPIDTAQRLWRLRPDVVVSTELGIRTILAAFYASATGWFGLRKQRCRLIISVSTTAWIESSRAGRLRHWVRLALLRRAGHVTHHGPECRAFLKTMGVPDEKMTLWDYSADPRKIYREPIRSPRDDGIHMVTVGQLIPRKGIMDGMLALVEVAKSLPEIVICWTILGDGPLMESLKAISRPANLKVEFLGNCDDAQIVAAYAEHEIMFFPTRGDEWGLVVDEAMHSGLVVIGTPRAQAVTTLIQHGMNGYIVDLAIAESLRDAMASWSSLSQVQRIAMRQRSRESVCDRTPETAARQIREVIASILRSR